MRYFTIELRDKLSNTLNKDYESYEKNWYENLKRYWEDFEKYESRFPKSFSNQYKKHAFHDFMIRHIHLNEVELKNRIKYNAELLIEDGNEKYVIIYEDVSKYDIAIDSLDYDTAIFLYSELFPLSTNGFSHEIICGKKNRIYIEFKKLKFKKVK
ncbi:hypothetical protein [Clostridium sp. YIM B02551]|uniref:hypothetical protein n=1 Tax=Clostridium sp. YIM B02551 TaxID=2910679 RepID=UPI001EEAE235|nr:hypothetical protein [Clostridium sp. YIM B02551]